MKTFVLIHGSYHGAWNWHKVVPLLEANGHKAIGIDMPGHGIDKQEIHTTTFDDYLKKTVSAVNKTEGKVILLAHSRNGIVISQVAEQCPEKVEKLIFGALAQTWKLPKRSQPWVQFINWVRCLIPVYHLKKLRPHDRL